MTNKNRETIVQFNPIDDKTNDPIYIISFPKKSVSYNFSFKVMLADVLKSGGYFLRIGIVNSQGVIVVEDTIELIMDRFTFPRENMTGDNRGVIGFKFKLKSSEYIISGITRYDVFVQLQDTNHDLLDENKTVIFSKNTLD